MKNYQIKSVLEQIAEQVFKMGDLREAQEFITTFLASRDINPEDKTTILENVSASPNMYQLCRYICNSLLKYEGMSVSSR